MGKLTTLSEMQLDAIGEIMNISMGSAATAVSELLNAKVWITTPKVTVIQASELNYDRLEPAICVKIEELLRRLYRNFWVWVLIYRHLLRTFSAR